MMLPFAIQEFLTLATPREFQQWPLTQSITDPADGQLWGFYQQ